MADNDVKIGIHTKATGTGAKDTASDFEKLKDGTEAAGEMAKQLRKELEKADDTTEDARKEVEKFADSLEEIERKGKASIERIKALHAAEQKLGIENKGLGAGIYETGKATESTSNKVKKLAKEESDLANETDDATRSLNKINAELAEAQKELAKTEIGTERFTKAQQRVTRLELERTAATKAGTKSTRNSGFAVLEASRALEDMQYGLSGALNNLTPLVQHLGLGAGLAGVISIVAVGFAVLLPKIASAAEAFFGLESAVSKLEKTKARLDIEERKRGEAEAKNAKRRKRENDEFLESLEDIKRAQASLFIDAENRVDQLKEELGIREKILGLQKDLAVSRVRNDDTLTEGEKAARIGAIERDFGRDAAAQQIESLESQNDEKRSAIEAAREENLHEQSNLLDRQRALEEELREKIRLLSDAQDLARNTEALVKATVDKQKDLELRGFLSRSDSEDAASFAEQFANDPQRARSAAKNQFIVGNDVQQTETLISTGQASIESKKTVKLIENEVAKLKTRIKGLEETRRGLDEKLVTDINDFEEQISQNEKQIQDIGLDELRAEEKAASDAKIAAEKEAADELKARISELTENASTEQLGAASEELRVLNEKLADGLIKSGEFAEVSRALQGLFADFSTGTAEQQKAVLKAQQEFQENQQKINSILSTVLSVEQAHSTEISNLQAQFERLQSNGGF